MAMDENSLNDFENRAKNGSYLIINSSMIWREVQRQDINVIKVPINDIAEDMGNPKSANIVALGIVLKLIDFVSYDEISMYLEDTFKGSAVKANKKALHLGYDFKVYDILE